MVRFYLHAVPLVIRCIESDSRTAVPRSSGEGDMGFCGSQVPSLSSARRESSGGGRWRRLHDSVNVLTATALHS